MKKAVIIFDSFKGTMSAQTVCSILEERILARFPDCHVISVPIADGGEGTVDCFLSALGGHTVSVTVNGPFFGPVSCRYAILNDGNTAVIETASCAGLSLAEKAGLLDPGYPSTYGVGELMLDAINRGCKRIYIGLGGSCTHDGGAGALSALGIRFYNERNSPFVPTGATLNRITRIDPVNILIKDVEIIALCDVKNFMCGENGAAYVFAPQKGAKEDRLPMLDENLRFFADKIRETTGVSVLNAEGTGAAGGMGGGFMGLLGAELVPGIETLLRALNIDKLLKGADIAFTGEGCLDAQTMNGKAVLGIARHAKRAGVPLIALAGDIKTGMEPLYREGLTAAFSINRIAMPFSEIKAYSREFLASTMDEILRVFAVSNKI